MYTSRTPHPAPRRGARWRGCPGAQPTRSAQPTQGQSGCHRPRVQPSVRVRISHDATMRARVRISDGLRGQRGPRRTDAAGATSPPDACIYAGAPAILPRYEHSKSGRRLGADDAADRTAALQSVPAGSVSRQDVVSRRMVPLHGLRRVCPLQLPRPRENQVLQNAAESLQGLPRSPGRGDPVFRSLEGRS